MTNSSIREPEYHADNNNVALHSSLSRSTITDKHTNNKSSIPIFKIQLNEENKFYKRAKRNSSI